MLQILNRDQEITTSALQTFHNGFTGGSEEILFYITNNHAEYYYQDITLEVVMVDLIEGDIFSESGWSIKIVQQSEQPTEKEWGEIFVNNKINISDIGSSETADTETIYPIWVRVFCPGHTAPLIKSDMSLKMKYSKRMVGDNV
jgi:hypothetical protein